MKAPATKVAPLEVLVLGDLRVRRAGRLLELPPSRKTRALLGYLAVTGRPQTRQRLCDLLWDGPGDPRAALRWSMTKLRPLLDVDGPRLVAEKEIVSLELPPDELDVAEVRRLVGSSARQASIDDLRRAATLFRGDLLEGLDLADCFKFHEWCAGQRETLRRLRLAVLDALVEKLDEDPEEALEHARARVAVDPFAEAGHVTLVRLLGRLRRTREGMEQYEACRHILASTFGARPSPELERARLALTAPSPIPAPHAEPAPAARPPPAVPPPAVSTVRTLPLAGRRRERAEVTAAANAVRATGRAHVLFVLGEPGLGKTRLLEELASLAASAGFLVLAGRAFEAEALRPYGAWIDALRSAPLDTLPELQRAELSPLLPELGAGRATLEQGRLFDAVVQALRSLAGSSPVALVLDDVHWLDDASAALLHYAIRAAESVPVLFACAARPGELADNPVVMRAARSFDRGERVVRLALDPLGREEIAELARSVDPALDAGRVFAESDGNPLFALALARAWGGSGATSRPIDALIDDHVAAVSGRARDVIPWAAALGRSFRTDRLVRVIGLPPAELLAALEELERHGVLRPGGDDGWDFAHDLFRRAAYAGLSEPRRRLLHREIARALAPLPDVDGALAGEVAYHAALGDDAGLAAHAAVAAGARAVRLFAVAEAKEIVERGLRFVGRLAPRERIAVSLALMRVLVDASRLVGGDPALGPRIEALIEEARQADLAAEVAVGYAILSHAHFASRDLVQTTEATDDGVVALRSVPPAEATIAMAETGGCLAILEHDLPRARMLLEEARRCGSLTGRAAVYLEAGTAIIQHLEGAAEQAAATFERAVRLAARDAPWEECPLLGRLALIDLELGYAQRVPSRTARMRTIAPRLHDAGGALLASALDLAARRAQGEAVSDAELDAVLSQLELDAKANFAAVVCMLAEQDLAAGMCTSAAARAERARAAADTIGRSSLAVLSRALLARCALISGDLRSARARVDDARQLLDPAVPMTRAVRLLDALAHELGVSATPLSSPLPPA